MRLIDADEVRKHAVETYQGNGVELETIMMVSLSAIDNAPTVLFPLTLEINGKVTDETIETFKRLMRDYKPQLVKLEPKRPQGEWKVNTISTFPQYQPDEYMCPFCNTIVNYRTNFCHNCGADMGGKKE